MTNQAHSFAPLIDTTGPEAGDDHLFAAPYDRRVVTDAFPGTPIDPDALKTLLDKSRLVKRARFNAQSRFEAKNMASISALTTVSMLSIAISMYSAIYQTVIPPQTALLLDFMSSITSLLVLSFGFIVALGSYQDKALRMQRCAMDLSRLIDEMQISHAVHAGQLASWTTAYNDIIHQCPYNHNDIDFAYARLPRDAERGERWALGRSWYVDVYGIYGVFLFALATFWYAAA